MRTHASHVHFQQLVEDLDHYLAITDGAEHAFYARFNRLDADQHAVVAYASGTDKEPVGCGAFKDYDPHTVEIKRMWVKPDHRGKGIAKAILTELEKWAGELGYTRAVLETGKRQTEAVQLYNHCHYHIIPCYGQYKGMENSLCFEKKLTWPTSEFLK